MILGFSFRFRIVRSGCEAPSITKGAWVRKPYASFPLYIENAVSILLRPHYPNPQPAIALRSKAVCYRRDSTRRRLRSSHALRVPSRFATTALSPRPDPQRLLQLAPVLAHRIQRLVAYTSLRYATFREASYAFRC